MSASIQKTFAFSELADGAEEAVEQTLKRFGLILERKIRKELDELGITVSGQKGLKGSVSHTVDRRTGGIRLEVGPTARYAIYVLEGTRPHFPPPGPIRSWVRKKLGITAGSTIEKEVAFWDDERGQVVRFTATVDELEQVTKAVQIKISRKGTEGQDFLSGPLNEVIDEVAPALAKDFKESIDE